MPSSVLKTSVNPKSPQFEKNSHQMVALLTTLKNEEERIREGGGAKAISAQHKKNRLTARERIAALIAMTNEIRAKYARGALPV